MSERTEAVCSLALMLAVSSVVAAVLIGWADCGKACSSKAKQVQKVERPRGAR
jgi:hypothetical protein